MDLKQLGKTSIKVPAIGAGTWEMGGDTSRDTTYDKEAIQAIRKAVELGIYLIDTAEMYGAGHCEEVVGEALKVFPRDKVFIVSKVWHNHMHYSDVVKAAEDSLKRLQTDWIDLYLVHFPNPEVPLRETMEAMEKLVERNLIRFIGVCNFNVAQMEEARNYLSNNELVVGQFDYSLFVRGREKDVIPYCQQQQMTIMAFRPLAKPSPGSGLPQNEFLQKIGKKYNKTAAQVALNWLIAQESVIAIPKALNLKHLEENAAAMGWRLSQGDIESISAHFSDYLSEYGIVGNNRT